MKTKDLLQKLNQMDTIPIEEWPNDARNLIAQGLDDNDPEIRLTATILAWAVLDQALANRLLEMVRSDPSDDVRARAAICFGPVLEDWDTFGDDQTLVNVQQDTIDQIRDTFKRIYEDPTQPKIVRRRVLEASVRAPEEWHEEAARKAFRSDDEDWRVTAVFCMGFIP